MACNCTLMKVRGRDDIIKREKERERERERREKVELMIRSGAKNYFLLLNKHS